MQWPLSFNKNELLPGPSLEFHPPAEVHRSVHCMDDVQLGDLQEGEHLLRERGVGLLDG